MVLLLLTLMLVPVELSVWVGSIRLPWYRAILLAAALPVFLQATRLRFAAFDYCMIAHVLWTVLGMLLKRGAGGIEPAGSYLVETLVVYLAVRLVLTRPGHFTALPRLIFVMLVPAILLAVPEALILHRHLVHDIAGQLTGFSYWVGYEYRLGMLRAASTFEHPILYGLFCASIISIVWVAARSRVAAVVMTAILCGGTILSGSSAPLLVMAVQLACLVGERISRHIPGRFRLLVGFTVFCFVFITIFSDRGVFQIIAQELTLNPATGYYRLLIWTNGIGDVLANPVFGIRPEDWTRPSWMSPSIDNNWLLLAMKGGLPGIFLLLAAMCLIWWRLYHRGSVPQVFDRIRFGWSCVLLALFLGGATVAYFGKMQPYFFLLLGYGAALAHLGMGPSAQEPAEGRQSGLRETGGKDDADQPGRRTVL